MRFASPNEALRDGIAMVFQETSLVPSMTVAQNLYLGDERFLNRLRGVYIAAQQFLQSLNFTVDPAATVATLGAAKRQMVEIARAVHHNAEVIIFDEPTATLTPEEKRHFFALMNRLKARGVSIVFISHALEEALGHSDRITILRDGERVVTEDTGKLTIDAIIRAMVGRTLSNELYRKTRTADQLRRPGAKVLSVQDISMGNVVRNNSFSIYGGQITGVFGLIGSGRTETFKIVVGHLQARLPARRRDRARRAPGALQRAARGGQGPDRLCHRGPQERRVLRDHVDRREPLCRSARRRPRARVLCQHARDARARQTMERDARHPRDQRQCPGRSSSRAATSSAW